MNRQLDEVIARVKELPDDQQREVAALIREILDNQQPDRYLTPEQIAEIERCMSDEEPYASEEEVRAVFDRLKK